MPSRRSVTAVALLVISSRALILVLLVVGLAGCVGSDPQMVETAKSLVPERSDITYVGENTGLAFEVGHYSATVRINDGGLGDGLLAAIEEQALFDGWEERYRCDIPAGIALGYARDDIQVDVSVRTKELPVNASIRVQRIGEGNPWPPDC